MEQIRLIDGYDAKLCIWEKTCKLCLLEIMVYTQTRKCNVVIAFLTPLDHKLPRVVVE